MGKQREETEREGDGDVPNFGGEAGGEAVHYVYVNTDTEQQQRPPETEF